MRRPNPELYPDAARAAWEAERPPADGLGPVAVHCKLITPMYGGGVKPGQVDRELPIRPGALRGQLRFWWRLLNGSGRAPQEVFRAESELWGGISSRGPRASQVTLKLATTPVEDRHLSRKSGIPDFPDYALILGPGDEPDLLRAGYEFELELSFARNVNGAQRQQVIEALRWWASFGGVGARTRRGLGAVRVTGSDAELKPVSIEPVSIEEVRSRGGWMLVGQPTGPDAVKAWKEAIDRLRRFRQGPGVGRNPGAGGPPGRSRWPEPDAIRRLTGRHASGHEPRHPVDGFFPRAAFGLPIVFHFKDRGRGDPPDRTLEPAGRDQNRMVSPLILRPWFDGRLYRPLALLLPGWKERVSVRVGFESGAARPAWPSDAAERAELAAQIEPMRDHGDDPLSAFMHYFEHFEHG